MTEHVTRHPPEQDAAAPDTWWSRYGQSLEASSISATSRHVIEADCRYVATNGVLDVGEPGAERWPAGRVRRGVVMGAVQSGKTASMLGVTALALDAGVDMVVILAGTRVALWR